jgi:hypothetical protein
MNTMNVIATDEVNGTCLQGYITATREQLETVFGKPGNGDGGYKFYFNWGAKITERDGTETIATIYDWKFERVVGLTEKVEWNIGGNSRLAVHLINDILCTELNLKASYTQARAAR